MHIFSCKMAPLLMTFWRKLRDVKSQAFATEKQLGLKLWSGEVLRHLWTLSISFPFLLGWVLQLQHGLLSKHNLVLRVCCNSKTEIKMGGIVAQVLKIISRVLSNNTLRWFHKNALLIPFICHTLLLWTKFKKLFGIDFT